MRAHRRKTKRVAVATLALALFGALVSCGGSGAPEQGGGAGDAKAGAGEIAGAADKVFAGRAGSEWLEQLRESDDPSERVAAISALASIGPFEGATAALIEALGDDEMLVRAGATGALQRFGRGARSELLIALRESDDLRVRGGAAVVVAPTAGNDPEVLTALASALQEDESEQVRGAVARVLGQLGPDAAPAVPALIAALEDASADVRMMSAVTLGMIGEPASDAIPALEQAQQDDDSNVRNAAAGALRSIRQ